jgi:hypothetical protein
MLLMHDRHGCAADMKEKAAGCLVQISISQLLNAMRMPGYFSVGKDCMLELFALVR